MTLLFLTQKIDSNDDDLAFVILWIEEFIRQGIDVNVVCLEKGKFYDSFPVYSLGKETGTGRVGRVIRFFKYIFTIKYDRVFVHMNPEYVTLGGWWWMVRRTPIYLWYTHYTMHIHLFLAGLFCRRMFAATKQSLPQYDGSSKKVVTGHGIDVNYWIGDGENILDREPSVYNLVSVHRICRSKRIEIGICALKFLPKEYNLSIYGRDVDKNYYQELQQIVHKNNLQDRVFFKGAFPMHQLKNEYPKYRLMINMAPETIDKTMLEAMLFGIFPITTSANISAIGLDIYPDGEFPEDIARFILSKKWEQKSSRQLLEIVRKKHSLSTLIEKLNEFIKVGK